MRRVSLYKKQIHSREEISLAVYKTEFYVGNLEIEFSLFRRTCFLNCSFIDDGKEEMLELEEFESVHLKFPFFASFWTETLAAAIKCH